MYSSYLIMAKTFGIHYIELLFVVDVVVDDDENKIKKRKEKERKKLSTSFSVFSSFFNEVAASSSSSAVRRSCCLDWRPISIAEFVLFLSFFLFSSFIVDGGQRQLDIGDEDDVFFCMRRGNPIKKKKATRTKERDDVDDDESIPTRHLYILEVQSDMHGSLSCG